MKKDTVVSIQQPATVQDALTEIIREGARDLLRVAIELEVEEFIQQFRTLTDERGRQRVVRNGHLPERAIQTGIGGVQVRVPRVRDRGGKEGIQEKVQYRSQLVPP